MEKLKGLITIAFIFCTSLLIGQTNKINIGLETGAGLRSLYGNEALKKIDDVSFGFSGGLAFQYNNSKTVSFKSNIAFERKGFSTKSTATDKFGNSIGELTFNSNFDYLTVPLMVRFTFGKKVEFFGNIGPYFGYLLKQTDITDAYGEFPKVEIDYTDNFTKLDLGIATGLGINIPVGSKIFSSLEIRNNLGLTNISSLPVVNNGSIKTNSTNLLIGFGYRLGAYDR